MNDNDPSSQCRGCNVVEYGLIASLIIVAVVGILLTWGDSTTVKTYAGKFFDYVQHKYETQ